MKNTFGTRLSDADLKLASNKVPDPSKSEEANKKIIEFWRFFDQMNIEKEKIAREVTKENGNFRPIDFEEQVQQRLDDRFGDEAQKHVNEVNEADTISMMKDGVEYNIPKNVANQALLDGFTIR